MFGSLESAREIIFGCWKIIFPYSDDMKSTKEKNIKANSKQNIVIFFLLKIVRKKKGKRCSTLYLQNMK